MISPPDGAVQRFFQDPTGRPTEQESTHLLDIGIIESNITGLRRTEARRDIPAENLQK